MTLTDALAWTEELLRIPSEYGREERLARHLAERLRELGVAELITADDSLLAVPRNPRPDTPLILLVGHIDTVPAESGDPVADNPVRRGQVDGVGEVLHGLGASDMKSGDGIALWALERALAEAPRGVELAVALYAREEGPYEDGALPALMAAAADWFDRAALAICLEPTDDGIQLGCLGNANVRVTFRGKRAHSARPWQGDNAIQKAGPLLTRLAALAPVAHTFHGFTFQEVVNATGIDFDGADNVLSDRCSVNVNHRFAPGKDRAGVLADVRALCGEGPELELVDYCPPGRVCADNPHVLALQAAWQAEHGVPLAGSAKQAWTDVGRLSERGIDAVNFGPGATAQCHQRQEWVSVAAIQRCQAAMERWLWGGP